MPYDNNVQIGSAGSGNTFNISQHHANEGKRHIKFELDSSSVEHLPRSTIKKRALAFLASLSILVLGTVADVLGILSFLGLQVSTWQVFWALIPIAVVGAALSNPLEVFAAINTRPNTANFANGRWIQQEENGDYVTYRKTAPCIYPRCSGTVFIQKAPPREQPNHTLIGVCDVGAIRHTYTVDYNGVGLPAEFDWRPLEQNK
jgi:hypothetical protein